VTDHLNRPELVRAVLQADMRGLERKVICACIGLADCDGFLDLDLGLLAPMTGNRFPYVRAALTVLIADGWLVGEPEGRAKLGRIQQGD
jgi:hypothetical protein